MASDEYLRKIYYDVNHPAAYGGLDKLYRFVKSDGQLISKTYLKKWLTKQNVYVKHKPVRRKFKRQQVIVPRKYYQFDADTVNMTRYDAYNKGYKYILIVIDILSRYAWSYPLKSLTGKEMVMALKAILAKNPEHLRTDGGKEFMNAQVERFLKSQKIEHFQTLNETKANYAERIIQTIKTKLTKYMNHKETLEWVSVLPDVMHSYNNTYHRSIKVTPNQALTVDDTKLWKIQYGPKMSTQEKGQHKARTKKLYEFDVGDRVKISYLRSVFERAYDQRWTDEIFTVIDRSSRQDIALYKLKDWSNEPISGTFYGAELQKVDVPEDIEYKIEKVLKYRKRNGKKEAFVKWQGWHKKFNSWIDASIIKDKS